jgi:nucleoside-diphosphate-sugar epimerase
LKVLITGSSGFIGRHLTRELTEHGHEVLGCDRNYTEEGHVGWRGIVANDDLRNPGVFASYLDAAAPDVVVHLAAQVGRLFGEDDLIHTVTSNAQMTTLIAHACGEAGVRLVYGSTSEIYGDNGNTICDEIEGPFTLPHNLYGLSKRWGEESILLYCEAPQPVLQRFSMPYGPGVVPGRGRAALPNILWQAVNRMEMPIHRGAERSWCWIGDTVRAVRLVLESGRSGPFNVGRDDNPVLMEEVARRACAMTGCPLDLIKLIDPPARQTVVKRLATDRVRELGWRPEVELDEGMDRVLDWVKLFDRRGRRAAVGDAVAAQAASSAS